MRDGFMMWWWLLERRNLLCCCCSPAAAAASNTSNSVRHTCPLAAADTSDCLFRPRRIQSSCGYSSACLLVKQVSAYGSSSHNAGVLLLFVDCYYSSVCEPHPLLPCVPMGIPDGIILQEEVISILKVVLHRLKDTTSMRLFIKGSEYREEKHAYKSHPFKNTHSSGPTRTPK